LISSQRIGAPGIITFPEWSGITLHAGPTQSGGASLSWLSRLTGQKLEALGALAGSASIRPESPLFLPHLEGERAPLWDPHSRGAFVGLNSMIGPAELAASVMEGVAFAARLAFEAIEASGGQSAETLRHGGGGTSSDTWCQIRANVLGRSLDRVTAKETGAMGALVMAGVASGTLDDLKSATQALVKVDRSFRPDEQLTAVADERFRLFQELYQGLKPINRSLTNAEC
jgi:xylulokinase